MKNFFRKVCREINGSSWSWQTDAACWRRSDLINRQSLDFLAPNTSPITSEGIKKNKKNKINPAPPQPQNASITSQEKKAVNFTLGDIISGMDTPSVKHPISWKLPVESWGYINIKKEKEKKNSFFIFISWTQSNAIANWHIYIEDLQIIDSFR